MDAIFFFSRDTGTPTHLKKLTTFFLSKGADWRAVLGSFFRKLGAKLGQIITKSIEGVGSNLCMAVGSPRWVGKIALVILGGWKVPGRWFCVFFVGSVVILVGMVGWENLPRESKKEHFLLEIIDSILEESISIRISIEAKTHQDLMYLPSRELTYLLPMTVWRWFSCSAGGIWTYSLEGTNWEPSSRQVVCEVDPRKSFRFGVFKKICICWFSSQKPLAIWKSVLRNLF